MKLSIAVVVIASSSFLTCTGASAQRKPTSLTQIVDFYRQEQFSQASLAQIADLYRQGQFSQVTEAGKHLLNSPDLSDADRAHVWDLLGLAYKELGDLPQAQHALEQSVHFFERNHSTDSLNDYAATLHHLGALRRMQKQYTAASQIWERALTLCEQSGDKIGISRMRMDLAELALDQHKLSLAQKYLDGIALDADSRGYTEDDFVAFTVARARLAFEQGDFAGAESGFEHSLALSRATYGEDHPFTGWSYVLLGMVQTEDGHRDLALANIKTGVAIIRHALGEQNPRYLTARIAYAQALDRTGSHQEAKRIKEEAEDTLRTLYPSACRDCMMDVSALR